ncbi:MAG: nitroreductase family protein, partial [Acidimicrobiales bacterium]|nr:nitroreductase family protein [Acidimicrobiales bacterium]
MQFDEVVRRRRMTRNFDPEPLDPAIVDRLLATALRAPAAGNTQGRDFVILEGPA